MEKQKMFYLYCKEFCLRFCFCETAWKPDKNERERKIEHLYIIKKRYTKNEQRMNQLLSDLAIHGYCQTPCEDEIQYIFQSLHEFGYQAQLSVIHT